MANMSYCRFRNTSADLRDCVDALEELVDNDAQLPSMDELDAMEVMQTRCQQFLRIYARFREQLNLDEMEWSSEHPEG